MIVLASNSASRRAMLEGAGISFEAKPAAIDERAIEQSLAGQSPVEVARALASAKALAVAGVDEPRWVLGSDSLVVVAGQRFDKPGSKEEAADHLRFFSGRAMHLHSAAALAHAGRVAWDCSETATLHLRPLSRSFIAEYLEAEWPDVAGCVGVFRIEGRGVQLFESVEGDYFTVLGMPLLRVLQGLRQYAGLPG